MSAKLNGRLRISKESSETLIRLARKWLKVNASGNGNCSIVSNVQMKNDVDLQHFSVIRCPLLFTIQFASVSVSISLSYWILDWLHSKKWANISKWWQDDSILNATHNESSSNVTANSNIEKWLFRWKGYNLPKHDIGIGVDWVSVTKKKRAKRLKHAQSALKPIKLC